MPFKAVNTRKCPSKLAAKRVSNGLIWLLHLLYERGMAIQNYFHVVRYDLVNHNKSLRVDSLRFLDNGRTFRRMSATGAIPWCGRVCALLCNPASFSRLFCFS